MIFLVFVISILGASESYAAAPTSTLDGVPIEAVEQAPTIRAHELQMGVGLFPFNAYYSGVTLNGGYTYHFSPNWGWEVVNASTAFSVEKGLTAELADKYRVNPEQIERLRYLFSSNLMYTPAHGKLLLLDEYIRYFRAALLVGPGLVGTSQNHYVAANFGARIEFFNHEAFAWKLEIRDNVTIPKVEHYITFAVGTGIRF